VTITVALLAAGGGRRFGAPKLLLPAGPGEVLLTRAARAALSLDADVLCILPPDAALHRAALRPLAQGRLRLVENPAAGDGMGTSLAAAAQIWGVAASGRDGLLALPADLPTIDAALLERLVGLYLADEDCLAAAVRDASGRLMAPAVLGAGLLPELASLGQDEGARSVLRRGGARTAALDLAEGLEDVDDFAAYSRTAVRLGWQREHPPAVAWRETSLPGPPAVPPGAWRVGGSVAWPVPGEAALCGYHSHDLPDGVRRVLWTGTGPGAQLRLLRAAALLSLQDETR